MYLKNTLNLNSCSFSQITMERISFKRTETLLIGTKRTSKLTMGPVRLTYHTTRAQTSLAWTLMPHQADTRAWIWTTESLLRLCWLSWRDFHREKTFHTQAALIMTSAQPHTTTIQGNTLYHNSAHKPHCTQTITDSHWQATTTIFTTHLTSTLKKNVLRTT